MLHLSFTNHYENYTSTSVWSLLELVLIAGMLLTQWSIHLLNCGLGSNNTQTNKETSAGNYHSAAQTGLVSYWGMEGNLSE